MHFIFIMGWLARVVRKFPSHGFLAALLCTKISFINVVITIIIIIL